MFENFYTTKMSMGKKCIKERFEKMRRKTGRKERIISFASAFVLLFAAVCATAFAADASSGKNADTVSVLYNGENKSLKNKPFISEKELYLPLREILNICGVENSEISYENQEVCINFHSKNSKYPNVRAYIKQNENGIYFDLDSDRRIMGINDSAENRPENLKRTTTHPAIILEGTTYVPLGMLIRIKNYYTAEAYDDRIYLDLLKGLEIRLYNSEGKYDAVISAPMDVNGANKFSPENYYTADERVFIGTAEDFQNLSFEHTEVNGYYWYENAQKRILVDENRRVLVVCPYENFRHESVNPTGGGTSSWESAVRYFEDDGIFSKRGGFNVFLNDKKTDENGNTYNRCLDYCFVDSRYLVKGGSEDDV